MHMCYKLVSHSPGESLQFFGKQCSTLNSRDNTINGKLFILPCLMYIMRFGSRSTTDVSGSEGYFPMSWRTP